MKRKGLLLVIRSREGNSAMYNHAWHTHPAFPGICEMVGPNVTCHLSEAFVADTTSQPGEGSISTGEHELPSPPPDLEGVVLGLCVSTTEPEKIRDVLCGRGFATIANSFDGTPVEAMRILLSTFDGMLISTVIGTPNDNEAQAGRTRI